VTEHAPTGDSAGGSAAVPDRFAGLRRSYLHGRLDESGLAPDPVSQFEQWLADAVRAGLPEPNAMVLSTASSECVPSVRMVLLKAIDQRGFVFFTNYGSRKSRDLAGNPRAALAFPWFWMERQVIITGAVERLPAAESADYFRSRPRGAQLGAWASRQSEVISGRHVLASRVAELEAAYPEGAELPVPDFWGGWRVVPEAVEFWQGRANRLHDRLRYRRMGDGWLVERLAP
jgi:pyridoxamine 5'-phosphate oxidase